VAKQPAGRFLELVDTAASVDQHQLAAGVDENGVDLQPHRAGRLKRGCEQTSRIIGPVAPQRFGREGERAVADDGDLDGAELEAVEARLHLLARLERMGPGGAGGRKRSGANGGRASAQEHSAVEHEHVCSPLRVGPDLTFGQQRHYAEPEFRGSQRCACGAECFRGAVTSACPAAHDGVRTSIIGSPASASVRLQREPAKPRRIVFALRE
jgi:hypothetical protein